MMTIAEVAERLNMSTESVRRLIKTGKLPAIKHTRNRSVRIDESAVAAYKDQYDQWAPIEAQLADDAEHHQQQDGEPQSAA